MKVLANNKGILATVAVFIVIMFIYNLFFKSEIVSVPSELEASSIGDDLLQIYEELQRVSLNQEIFTSKGYLLLTDFGIPVPSAPTGRSNPFDVIGRD